MSLPTDNFRIMRKVLPVRAKWDRAKKKTLQLALGLATIHKCTGSDTTANMNLRQFKY